MHYFAQRVCVFLFTFIEWTLLSFPKVKLRNFALLELPMLLRGNFIKFKKFCLYCYLNLTQLCLFIYYSLLCISTSFWVLSAPENWSKPFFQPFFNLFVQIQIDYSSPAIYRQSPIFSLVTKNTF